ncbi:response regulator transcription factor [Sphingomonas sp. R86521]|uniref:response regulator transcription factor n=1 Tax=Sphingomonas sp. R86521 TaxID=3093860 RepID=UPI0036D23A25
MHDTTTALVIIVDDDPLVRGALDSLFRSVGLATACYGSAAEVLGAPMPQSLCCMVVDVRMPGIGGFEFHDTLAARGVSAPIIFLTGHGDIPMGVRAMKAGAVDFLTKPVRDQDILDAVNTALAKGRQRFASDRDVASSVARHSALTPRESEVMAGVVRGLLNKQIAGELGIAEITVKMHRANVMKKMGVRTVADLVRSAERLARATDQHG